ncbi:MAG: hypothetical protein QXD46_01215, partial [Thermofilum sp.]
VLDEPTTGQDHAGRRTLASLVRKLHGEGFTIIIITHDMKFVSENAGRTVLIANGQVVLDGPTRSVLQAVEVLKENAIKPPQIVQLSLELQRRGFKLDALTMQEAVEQVKKILRG